MKKITIYTDGACSGNPGLGGWGAILIYKKTEKEISGFKENTTNNEMELCACTQALSLLKEKCSIDIYSDSAYVVNGFNEGWLENWKINGFKNSQKKEIANKSYWIELDQYCKKNKIIWL